MKEREHIKWRRGRSIPFRWSIKIGGQVPELAEGEIKLFMRNSLGAKVAWPYEIEDGNVLVFDWLGKDQKRGGMYSFTALYHDGLEDQNVLDSCVDIELVESTCDENDCCGCGDFAIEPVYMEGDFLVTGGTSKGAVRYDKQQDLTYEQQAQARENIGVEDEIFVAVYGVTTFAEVKEAYEAGKTIICKHRSFYEPLVSALLNTFTFCTLLNKTRLMSSLDANGWVELDAETLATTSDLAGKQDTISDLSDIRSGASAGATALQPTDIASWAKQPTKPTYTASEVGALPSSTEIPTKTSDLTNDSGYIGDAPSGGEQYARQAGEWVKVQGGFYYNEII